MAWHDAPWLTYALIVAGLATTHLLASGGTGTILPSVLERVSTTPATTLSRIQNHVIAGFFHNNLFHIGFNLCVFSAAFFFATRGHHPLATAGTMYAIGPLVVLSLHLILVRPLAAGGMEYASGAMNFPLIGFSVMAYACAGMAVAQTSGVWFLAWTSLFVAFEVTVGVVLAATGPFIWVYHLTGFFVGLAVRRTWP